jgi:hypothetical protein
MISNADVLDVSHRGAVILGRLLWRVEVIDMAAEIPLRGLILSSMDSALVKGFKSECTDCYPGGFWANPDECYGLQAALNQ